MILIRAWKLYCKVCVRGSRVVMVAITNFSRGLLCSPLLWIIRAEPSIAGGRIIRAVLLRGELIRGDLQLPTVIPGDLWWAVGSGFNTKWAVSFLNKEQPRILIKNEIYEWHPLLGWSYGGPFYWKSNHMFLVLKMYEIFEGLLKGAKGPFPIKMVITFLCLISLGSSMPPSEQSSTFAPPGKESTVSVWLLNE